MFCRILLLIFEKLTIKKLLLPAFSLTWRLALPAPPAMVSLLGGEGDWASPSLVAIATEHASESVMTAGEMLAAAAASASETVSMATSSLSAGMSLVTSHWISLPPTDRLPQLG